MDGALRDELIAMAEEDRRVREELAETGELYDGSDLGARAHVEDRIRVFEGRRQRYGTQLDWDERGTFARLPLEDPGAVDDLRAAVGLPPLEAVSPPPGEPVPAHPAARRRAAD